MSYLSQDIYHSVTNQIIESLEAGVPPWVCPWQSGAGDLGPANLASGRSYRGINVLLLNLCASQQGYRFNRWMTFQQAIALGGHVRSGERGTPIVFFKMHELDSGDPKPPALTPEEVRRVVPLLRTFTVFNADQVEGLSPDVLPVSGVPGWNACQVADFLLEASGAHIRHGGNRAFYALAGDLIQMPERGAFASAEDYYSTALHELTHWTGHPDRCNRELRGRAHLEAYAFEELVAEMGSAFLTGYCNLPGGLHHASYIQSWLNALRNDKRLVFTAAAMAQKAADFLLPERVTAPAVGSTDPALAQERMAA